MRQQCEEGRKDALGGGTSGKERCKERRKGGKTGRGKEEEDMVMMQTERKDGGKEGRQAGSKKGRNLRVDLRSGVPA
jgi:hypothetical protein